jgi:hypothetical protein
MHCVQVWGFVESRIGSRLQFGYLRGDRVRRDDERLQD